jgi:hypothetical protein
MFSEQSVGVTDCLINNIVKCKFAIFTIDTALIDPVFSDVVFGQNPTLAGRLAPFIRRKGLCPLLQGVDIP